MISFPAARHLGEILLYGLIPFPQMKPRQSVVQKGDCLRKTGQSEDRSQKAAGCRSEAADGLAATATARLGLW